MGNAMSKLRVKCIACKKEWQKDSSFSWGYKDITSSLCDSCFRKTVTPVIRKRQLNRGHLDCFDKPGNYCDEFRCKYRKWCSRTKEAA
jgi:hypothetical protein